MCQNSTLLAQLKAHLSLHRYLNAEKPTKCTNKTCKQILFYKIFRSYHRHSQKAKDPRRRVRIHRYWNEDFLVAVQFSQRQFNDLYVWKWMECQNPKFLYNFDLYELYPQGLFPTAFFLWKHYLVLMPDTGYLRYGLK